MTTINSEKTITRVDTLDYLRGLAALGILVYHMHLFSFGEVDASETLARIKIYGVSIFYILSGLTLFIVYNSKLTLQKDVLIDFYVKRFFRIVPLLWLVTILTYVLIDDPIRIRKLILNLLVLPGIVKPENLIANGAWSIGNELFFYLIFPFIIVLARKSKIYLIGSLLISFLIFAYFSFYRIDEYQPLGAQWGLYVNPFNQVFYFVLGVSIGGAFNSKKLGRWSVILLCISLVVFFKYPVSGEPVVLVVGVNRMVFAFFIALICLLFFKTNFDWLPRFVTKGLKTLGDISYSLYLLHPLVYFGVVQFLKVAGVDSAFILIALTVLFSLLISYINYTYFEKYFIALGKMLLLKIRPSRNS